MNNSSLGKRLRIGVSVNISKSYREILKSIEKGRLEQSMTPLVRLLRELFSSFRPQVGPLSGEQLLAAEQLEPRILYSAAPAPASAEAVEEAPAQLDSDSEASMTAAQASAEFEVAGTAAAVPAVSEREGEVSGEVAVDLVAVDDGAASLNQEVVEILAAEARQRWIESGISAEQIAALDSVSYQIADVGGAHLGVANGATITIDDDAGGTGVGNWFVDATPGDDVEFGDGSSVANGRFDLLSTLIHEQGHVLGLADLYDQRSNVMDGLLDTGARRLPVMGQADHAVAGSVVGDNYLTANIVRASTDSNGVQANDESYVGAMSADGRYVVFESDASNLVGDDTNGQRDIFVKDLVTGELTRVSTDSNGQEASGGTFGSINPDISADGRFVVFESDFTNLVADDTNFRTDIFVKDLQTGELTRVSTNSEGNQANQHSYRASISADGRYVAFDSSANNLVSGDTSGSAGVVVKDLKTGDIRRVSTSSTGQSGNGPSRVGEISADGRHVAFQSDATDLVADDTNGVSDIFVKNLKTGKLTRVSTTSDGVEGTGGDSYVPSISADGRYVAYHSAAVDLVDDDSNGSTDVFVKDLKTGITIRVSTDSTGDEGTDSSTFASISADGRYVAFRSASSNLAAGDTNGTFDIFVKDLLTGTTTLVSTDASGAAANGQSLAASMSADARVVAFSSHASNMVSGDSNGERDIFVKGIASVTGDYTTSVEIDSSGNLVIEDIGGADGDTDDKLFIGIVDDRLEVRDAKATVGSTIVGSTMVGTKGRGVSIDLSAFTGDIIVNTLAGKDSVTFGDIHSIDGGISSYDEDYEEKIEVRGEITLTGASAVDFGAQQIVLQKGSTISTDSGRIDLYGAESERSGVTGIYANGATLSTGTGRIGVMAYAGELGGGNRGIFLKNTDVTTVDADVSINGSVRAPGSKNIGAQLGKGTNIMVGGVGAVYLSGSVRDAKNGNVGLRIDKDVNLQTQDGDIYVSGGVGNSGSKNIGIKIGQSTIQVDGAGDLRISGSTRTSDGAKNTALSLSGTTVNANGGGDLLLDYMGNEPAISSGNRGVVLKSVMLHSTSGDIDIKKNPNIGSSGTFGNTGVQAVKTTIISNSGNLLVRGYHDDAASGKGNRGLVFSKGLIDIGGTVQLDAHGGGGSSDNTAMQISSSSITASGSVVLNGDSATTTTGSGNRGIDLHDTSLRGSYVSVFGNAGTGTSNNEGVRIVGGSIEGVVSTALVRGGSSLAGGGGTTKSGNNGVNLKNTGITGVTNVFVYGNSSAGTNSNIGVKMNKSSVTSSSTLVLIQGDADELTASTGKNNRGIDARKVEWSAATSMTVTGISGRGTNTNEGISINGGTLVTASGDLTIEGTSQADTSGSKNGGVMLKNVDAIAGDDLQVEGTGGGGTSQNTGIHIRGGSMVSTGGELSIYGDAQATTTGSSNHGTEISGVEVAAVSSDLQIDGVGGGGSSQNMGVRVIGSTITANNGSGVIGLFGTARSVTTGELNIGVYVFDKVVLNGSCEFGGNGGGGTGLNHGLFMNKKITANDINDLSNTAGAGADSEEEAGDFFDIL